MGELRRRQYEGAKAKERKCGNATAKREEGLGERSDTTNFKFSSGDGVRTPTRHLLY